MEKLSSILPSSPRVKSVDIKEMAPVRPGAPAMGRAEGRVSARDRLTLSANAKDKAFAETMGAKNPREAVHVKIADNVAKKFFETRISEPVDVPKKQDAIDKQEALVVEPSDYEPPAASDYVKGSFVDTEA